jgi:hypothetical protein
MNYWRLYLTSRPSVTQWIICNIRGKVPPLSATNLASSTATLQLPLPPPTTHRSSLQHQDRLQPLLLRPDKFPLLLLLQTPLPDHYILHALAKIISPHGH